MTPAPAILLYCCLTNAYDRLRKPNWVNAVTNKDPVRFILGTLYGNSVSEYKRTTTLRSKIFLPIAFGAVLMLSACHFGAPKTPTGQVVATVGAREITRRELQVELDGSTATTPAAQKAQQQAALQRIIQRVILANAAKAQGLDKDPNFALLSQRANEALLGQLLERKTATSVPAPSNEEADQFEQTNPNLFAERKLFDVDQIRLSRPPDPQIIAKLQPLKTLDDIANYLTQNHIPFQRGANVMDAVGQNPKLLSAILALPPHEVFILSSATEIFVNEIRETRTSPFVGEPAKKFALNSLKAQHVQDAVVRQLRGIVAKGTASVRVNKEFEPPKTPVKKAQQN